MWGQKPTSAATEQTRWARDLELRPSNTPSDVLELVPGLIMGQHHGGGKADQILFRGFDSDHGTDFAVFIDGIPVNMVSHAHGQGYADMHWLIPETIDRVEIYKGPYFVQLGDFATSGAMNIITKRRDKDTHFTITGGSYNTQRYVGVLSPPQGTPLTPYAAFEVYHNDGPFKNENNYNRYNIFTKLSLLSTANSNLSFLGTFFKTQWDASMALRMGMESDVTLKIEVDTEGIVTKAEIIKSGGAGFDDEALKAVKQSRFEPAQKDGRNVPAEFTYIYRFRLAKRSAFRPATRQKTPEQRLGNQCGNPWRPSISSSQVASRVTGNSTNGG